MDPLFAAPPPDRRSNRGIVVSASVHLAVIVVVIGVGARITSAPPRPRQSLTFINASTKGFTPPPASDLRDAPRAHRVEPTEPPRTSAARVPAPIERPPAHLDAATPEPPLTPVAQPIPAPRETRTPALAEESPTPVVGMFDRAVGAHGGTPPAVVRVAGFAAAERPVLRAAVDTAPQAGGFDRVAAPRVSMTMATPVAAAIDTPIEVLFKPSPDYTDEARTLRVEGEVVVEAAFNAAGQASVVRVIQGLGHGLDETAARAVAGIRFRAATRDGVPVTVRTIVRIQFRLT